VLVFILLCVLAVAFDPLGSKAHSFEEMDYERFQHSVLHGNSHTKLWERRCKFLMCSCVGIDETHRRAFRDIGSKQIDSSVLCNVTYYFHKLASIINFMKLSRNRGVFI